MTPTTAETVRFTLIPGADPGAFAVAAEAVNTWVAQQPGFINRTLSQDEDGHWLDHVTWADMASARTAAAKVMEEPTLAPFMALIDPASIDMRHATIRSHV
jgi:hypothetical protein